MMSCSGQSMLAEVPYRRAAAVLLSSSLSNLPMALAHVTRPALLEVTALTLCMATPRYSADSHCLHSCSAQADHASCALPA
jgi:hypothetical protein